MAKMNMKRTPAAEQPAELRQTNFKEVALGYTAKEAVVEANRCLVCGKPQCVEGCPVGINIPQFISLIKEQKFVEASQAIKQANALPAICGRVCPQETQCEIKCVIGRKGEPVSIGRLERFAADYERESGANHSNGHSAPVPPSGFKVAVIGSGPSGLACARELRKFGHEVVIFEALHKPGGVLVYGIPEFRLPKAIVDDEIRQLQEAGVKIMTDTIIGMSYKIEELLHEGYDAVFIGTGAGLPKFLNIPGENLMGVVSANEFLTRVNLMEGYRFPETDTPVYVGPRTVVLGGGNTAMDAARCARRLGAEVTISYRRSREEMPARVEEVNHAEEEGIHYEFLTAPTRIIGNEKGWVTGLECQRMGLGEPDESGRRRPVPIQGSEFVIDCEMIINAVGSGINSLIFRDANGLKRTKWGTAIVDEETGATSVPGIFAGGDVAIGAATVILAMGTGKKAAHGIHQYLMEKHPAHQ